MSNMTSTRQISLLNLDVSMRSLGVIVILTLAVGASEALLFYGYGKYTIWAYSIVLLAISLAPLYYEREVAIFQAFVLIPLFRLVNLSVPVFVELTLFWLPLIYGPFIPVIVYLGRQTGAEARAASSGDGTDGDATPDKTIEGRYGQTASIKHELPWWVGGHRGKTLRRRSRLVWRALAPPAGASRWRSIPYRLAQGLFLLVLPVFVVAFLASMSVITVYLAELEYAITTPAPLIPSLTIYQIGVLTVIMVVFVGFVEEILFRGILQKVLERQLGVLPGLLIASGLFGLMYSAHGLPLAIAFASGVGLLFGIIYDLTDSLVLVSSMHGLLNVLLFGVIPLDGGSSIDLIREILLRELNRAGLQWVVETVPLLEGWVLPLVA